jgi:protein SCO1/2
MLVPAILACTEPEPMLGTVLEDDGQQAPSFELMDQFGQSATLTQYDGDVVLLTFLYTYCPDVCPAVTGHLRTTHELLGDDAERVDFVAISLDPERDTVERAHEYSEAWRMLDKWDFLVGDREQLASIWKGYYVDPLQAEWTRGEPTASPRAAGHTQSGVDALQREIATRYEVLHATPVYLIDRDRRIRVLFTPPLDPDAIAHDIRLLLK